MQGGAFSWFVWHFIPLATRASLRPVGKLHAVFGCLCGWQLDLQYLVSILDGVSKVQGMVQLTKLATGHPHWKRLDQIPWFEVKDLSWFFEHGNHQPKLNTCEGKLRSISWIDSFEVQLCWSWIAYFDWQRRQRKNRDWVNKWVNSTRRPRCLYFALVSYKHSVLVIEIEHLHKRIIYSCTKQVIAWVDLSALWIQDLAKAPIRTGVVPHQRLLCFKIPP